MATSDLGLSKIYKLKFDLENEEEVEKFLNSWKKYFQKECQFQKIKLFF